jgi:hypothetical protein
VSGGEFVGFALAGSKKRVHISEDRIAKVAASVFAGVADNEDDSNQHTAPAPLQPSSSASSSSSSLATTAVPLFALSAGGAPNGCNELQPPPPQQHLPPASLFVKSTALRASADAPPPTPPPTPTPIDVDAPVSNSTSLFTPARPLKLGLSATRSALRPAALGAALLSQPGALVSTAMSPSTTTTPFAVRRTTSVQHVTPVRLSAPSASSAAATTATTTTTPAPTSTTPVRLSNQKRPFGASPSPYKLPRKVDTPLHAIAGVQNAGRASAAAAVVPSAAATKKRQPLCDLPARAAVPRVTFAELARREPRFGGEAPADVRGVDWQNGCAFVFARERLGSAFQLAPVEQSVMKQRLLQLGADSALLTDVWLDHHYGLIVWKLAALERAFPASLGARHLTATRVLEQLAYRYEREINRAERSILRKLLERDASPSSQMVLFVAAVLDVDAAVVVVSDGWHFMRAKFDAVLASLLAARRIAVGDKLRVCGATLSDGEAVAPFEDLAVPTNAAAVTLQLHYNGTRRAPWTARLGAQRAAVFRVSIKSLRVGSGTVPFIDVCVQRVYPMRYRETTGSGAVWRGEADERLAERDHDRAREQRLEKHAYKWRASRPAAAGAAATATQDTAMTNDDVDEFRDSVAANPELQQRDVVPCFRMRVSELGAGAAGTECFLSLYRLPQLRESVREGESYRVFGFVAGKAALDGCVHLTTTNRARLQRLPPAADRASDFRARAAASFASLQRGGGVPLRSNHDFACVVVAINTAALDSSSVLVGAPSDAGDDGEALLAVLRFGSLHQRLQEQLRVGTLLHVLDATLTGWRQTVGGAALPCLTLDLDTDVTQLELAKAKQSTRCRASLRDAAVQCADWALSSSSFGLTVEHAANLKFESGVRGNVYQYAPVHSPPPSPFEEEFASHGARPARSSSSANKASDAQAEQQQQQFDASQRGSGMAKRRAAVSAHVTAGRAYLGSFALPTGRAKLLVDATKVDPSSADALPAGVLAVDATRVGIASSACMLDEQRCFFHMRNKDRLLDGTVVPSLEVALTFGDGKHEWNVLLPEPLLAAALKSASSDSSEARQRVRTAARLALEDAVRLATAAELIAADDDGDNDAAERERATPVSGSVGSQSAHMTPSLKRRATLAVRRYREKMLTQERLVDGDDKLAERACELARRAIWLRASVLRDLFERDDGGDDRDANDEEALDALLSGCDECEICLAMGLERRVLLMDDEWQALFRSIGCMLASRPWQLTCSAQQSMLTPTGHSVEMWLASKCEPT